MLDSDVRASLERRPRKPFDIDEDRALAALRLDWHDAYELPGRDGEGRWWALRRDGLPGVSARWPDELRSEILKDFAAEPVRLR